jgi:hypothetical protein
MHAASFKFVTNCMWLDQNKYCTVHASRRTYFLGINTSHVKIHWRNNKDAIFVLLKTGLLFRVIFYKEKKRYIPQSACCRSNPTIPSPPPSSSVAGDRSLHLPSGPTTGNCAASIGFLTSVGNFEKPLKEP